LVHFPKFVQNFQLGRNKGLTPWTGPEATIVRISTTRL